MDVAPVALNSLLDALAVLGLKPPCSRQQQRRVVQLVWADWDGGARLERGVVKNRLKAGVLLTTRLEEDSDDR